MKLNKPILHPDYRHSASRGVDYTENPSLWLMRNYFGIESKQNTVWLWGQPLSLQLIKA